MEKREELRHQEEEKRATVEDTEWNKSAFWRVPPWLDDLDGAELEFEDLLRGTAGSVR